jgi:hypothetical protein
LKLKENLVEEIKLLKLNLVTIAEDFGFSTDEKSAEDTNVTKDILKLFKKAEALPEDTKEYSL